jgi:hypothetical protein
MPTTPNGFFYRDNSLAIDPYAGDGDLASSIDAWANTREIQDYRWANAAARTAETGMVAGAEGFQVDTALTYKYDGSAWKPWQSLKPVSYTPTWTNITVGNAVQSWTYTLAAGLVTVRGRLTFGTTTTIGAGPWTYMTLPLPANGLITGAPNGGSDQVFGSAFFEDLSTNLYPGIAVSYATGGVIYARMSATNASGTYTTANGILTAIPFAWATGDFMNATYTYQPD